MFFRAYRTRLSNLVAKRSTHMSSARSLLVGGSLALVGGLLILSAVNNRRGASRLAYTAPGQTGGSQTGNMIKEAQPTKQLALSLLDYNVVDVREPNERTDTGFVPTSVNIPLGFVVDGTAEVPKDKPLLMVCRSGKRSMAASEALLARGYTDITNLTGGTLGWIEAGLPVERISTIKEISPSKKLESELGKYHVVDVREPEERVEIGFVPGSTNLPLATILEGSAIVPVGKPLLMVCKSGRRSMKAAETLLQKGYDVTNLTGGTLGWIETGLKVDHITPKTQ